MKQYNNKEKENADSEVFSIRMPQTHFLPLFLVLQGKIKAKQRSKQIQTKIRSPSWRALELKGPFLMLKNSSFWNYTPKRIVSTIRSFPQALKSWKQTNVKTNHHPHTKHIWGLPLSHFVWDFKVHFTTSKRPNRKQNPSRKCVWLKPQFM